MSNLISQIKRYNPDLKEAEIAGILYILKTENSLTNTDLIIKTGLPKESLKNFKTSIKDLLENSNDDGILLNEQGRKVLNALEVFPYEWSLVENSLKTDIQIINLAKSLKEIREKYKLSPQRDFDQFFATTITSVAKTIFINKKGYLAGKRIAILGDDDMLSVILGLLKVSYKSITVFDVDEAMLTTLKNIASDLNTPNVNFVLYDARNSIKDQFYGKFDVVITDPPYTKSGINLFLNRAIEFLEPTKDFEGKYIYLYYGNSFKSPEKTLKVQELITRFNLVIEDKIDKFSRYHGADSIGSAGSLYILKTTKFTQPMSEKILNTQIYTYENQKEEAFPFVDHVVLKVNGVAKGILTSKATLMNLLGKFCKTHKLNVVDTKITKFKGGGISITYILANSNLVVHTWTEFNALHLDLITCSPIYNKSEIGNTVFSLFNTRQIEINYVE